jgi:acetyltransferase-like isoleucine patch superfamily enzyme
MIIKLLNRILKKVEKERKKHLFPKAAGINISEDLAIGSYSHIQLPSTEVKIVIEPKVIFREFCNILVYKDGTLIIEENVFFNNYCSINCLGSIKIGANTLFGEGVKIYDHNHLFHFQDKNLVVEREQFKIGSVKIGKNCWIGSNVTILNNVEIGDNVIVGANNLIYKSIPSNVVVKAKADFYAQHLEDTNSNA